MLSDQRQGESACRTQRVDDKLLGVAAVFGMQERGGGQGGDGVDVGRRFVA
ncbi:hypothetical protein [Serratia marcescens]|uniref:hypothetical protein n=1 Tax=Serratia marcescens TaxID=615 RepID=UPI001D11F9FD|nr:hypothetical protein [Serratia marcescens]